MLSTYCFSVVAETTPGALGRVLDVFGLFGEVPSQLVSRREGPGGQDLVIDAQIEAMSATAAAAAARRLTRVCGVTTVLYSAKRSATPLRWAA